MRFVMIFACFLGIWGPFLVAGQKKIMLIIPRTIRRVHTSPWRQFTRPPFAKAPKFLDEHFLSSQYSSIHQNKKFIPKGKSISFNQHLPQGGDDFDHSHDEINHVVIPHGKGISHAITYGHGYVPHGALKDHAGFSEAPGSPGHTEDNRMNYYSPAHVTHQADNYLHQEEGSTNHYNNNNNNNNNNNQVFMHERRKDDRRQRHFSPSPHDKSLNKIIYNPPKKPIYATNSFIKDRPTFPSQKIPNNSFNANKEGIVFRDSVDLADYQKKLMELTRNWPAALNGLPSSLPGASNTNIGPLPHDFPGNSFDFRPGGNDGGNSLASYAPQHQGYAVKEDVEDIPRDFHSTSMHNPHLRGGGESHGANFYGISQPPFPANAQYGFSGFPGAPGLLQG